MPPLFLKIYIGILLSIQFEIVSFSIIMCHLFLAGNRRRLEASRGSEKDSHHRQSDAHSRQLEFVRAQRERRQQTSARRPGRQPRRRWRRWRRRRHRIHCRKPSRRQRRTRRRKRRWSVAELQRPTGTLSDRPSSAVGARLAVEVGQPCARNYELGVQLRR